MASAAPVAAEPCPRRGALDDIVTAAEDSGIKRARPVRFWHHVWVWLLAAAVSALMMFEVARSIEHQGRVAWVRAVQQSGLSARLDVWRSPLFPQEVAVAELRDQADLTTLLSTDAKRAVSIHLFVYFDLTPLQRNSLQTRLACQIVRLGR